VIRAVFLAITGVALFAFAACGDDGDEQPDASVTAGVTATAATTTPEATPAEGAIGAPDEELLYVGAEGGLWIWSTESGERRQIVDASACVQFSQVGWSPDGSMFTAVCGPGVETDLLLFAADGTLIDTLTGYDGSSAWPDSSEYLVLAETQLDDALLEHRTLAVLAIADGGLPERVDSIDGAWTWAGFRAGTTEFAYYRAPDAPCAPDCTLGLNVRDVATGEERSFGDLVPFGWLGDTGTLIVQADYQRRTISLENDAFLLDTDTDERIAIPALSNQNQYWPTTDGSTIVALAIGRPGIGLDIIDAASGEVTPIFGSTIQYPSDHIPPEHIRPATDRVYWFSADGDSGWYSAGYDGGGLTRHGATESFWLQFSPSASFVAYPSIGSTTGDGVTTMNLYVATIDGTRTVDLGVTQFNSAWRP
jgi:hypothetical protein